MPPGVFVGRVQNRVVEEWIRHLGHLAAISALGGKRFHGHSRITCPTFALPILGCPHAGAGNYTRAIGVSIVKNVQRQRRPDARTYRGWSPRIGWASRTSSPGAGGGTVSRLGSVSVAPHQVARDGHPN